MEILTYENLVKSYLEIGVLGILSIVFILIAVYLVKKMRTDFDWFKTKVSDKDDNISLLYQKFFESQQKQNEYLIKQIVNQITQHTPSPKENKKLAEIQNKIDNLLKDIMLNTNASRVCLVQYHNGGRGINKQSFLKMSCTNEQAQVGEKHFITIFQNQFRSVLSYVVNTLDIQDNCYIEDINQIKSLDYGTYDFLVSRNIKQVYIRAIHGEENMVIGFVFISFTDSNPNNGNERLVDEELNRKINTIETLLSIDINN